MTDAEAMADVHKSLAETLAQALQNLKIQRTPVARLSKFLGRPKKVGDPTVDEWVEELEAFCRQSGIEGRDKVATLLDHLGGVAKEEIACCPPGDRGDYAKLLGILRARFGPQESVQSLNAAFYARHQQEGETLTDFSRALMLFYNRVEAAAADPQESEALTRLREKALREQFVKGVAHPNVRRELRKLDMECPDLNFFEFRDKSLKLYQELDGTVGARTCNQYDEQFSVDKVATTGTPQSAGSDIQKLLEGQTKLAQLLGSMSVHQEQTTKALKDLTKVIEQSLNNKPKFERPISKCAYCSKRGHEYDKCFKRKYDEARKLEEPRPNQSGQGPSPATGVPDSGKATPLS